jgi:hypothetical protein
MNEIDVDKIDIKLLKFGDHELYFIERDNPEDLRVYFIIRCRKCGSHITTSIKLHNAVVDLKYKISSKLFDSFRSNIVESCDEAKRLGIINSIHKL